MDPLEDCIAELLEQFPAHRILAVVPTAERAAQVEKRFDSAVKAVPVCSPLYGDCFDAVVSELPRSEVLALTWMANVLPTRMAPGAVMYHVRPEV